MSSIEVNGSGMNPDYVANAILMRAFKERIPVTPMKLQKLLFFTTCLYERHTHKRLLSESFQPWKYGPVCPSVYAEFKGFHGSPIRRYAQDALGKSYTANEHADAHLRDALDTVWQNMKNLTAVELSRVTHRENSAWWKAWEHGDYFINENNMANDHTFDDYLA